MSVAHRIVDANDGLGFSGHFHLELPALSAAQLTELDTTECIDTVSKAELVENLRQRVPDEVSRQMVKYAKFYDKSSLLALLASHECLNGLKAHVSEPSACLRETGFVCGTYGGPLRWVLETNCNFPLERLNKPPLNRLSAVVGYFGGVIGNVTIPLGLVGPAQVFSNLDSVGLDALVYACASVKHGRDAAFVVGGVDTCTSRFVREQLKSVLAISDVRSEMMKEGAGFLYLETRSRAAARDASLLAQIRSLSFGMQSAELAQELAEIYECEGISSHDVSHTYLLDFRSAIASSVSSPDLDLQDVPGMPHDGCVSVLSKVGYYFGATVGITLSKAIAHGRMCVDAVRPDPYVLLVVRDFGGRCGIVLLRVTGN